MDTRKFVQVPDDVYKLVVDKQTELREYMKTKIDIKELVGMAITIGLEEISIQDFINIEKIEELKYKLDAR